MAYDVELKVAQNTEWGYYVTYKVILYDDLTFLAHTGSDNSWIERLEVDKDFYLNTLINTYGAYNNASYKFPKIFFKNKENAERALVEFYEPILILRKLME